MEQERVRKVIASNRKARHDYEVLETLEAGIVLTGTEVKSLRSGDANLQDSYAMLERGEVWLWNAHISPYSHGNQFNHDPRRTRKLLLQRKQIRKLLGRVAEKGLTLIPLSIYFSGPYVKVELAIARGKKQYDKRESLKERDSQKEIKRHLKRSYS